MIPFKMIIGLQSHQHGDDGLVFWDLKHASGCVSYIGRVVNLKMFDV